MRSSSPPKEASDEGPHAWPVSEVLLVRMISEASEDYAALANILCTVVPGADMECLTVLADTLTVHQSTFTALDVCDVLERAVLDRYRALRLHLAPRKSTVTSLVDLTGRCALSSEITVYLDSEAGLCQQPTGIAANTPASEGVVGDLLGSQGELDEELEHIFASGQSMSGETFAQVLERVKNILLVTTNSWGARDFILRYGNLMVALRAFNEDRFDQVVIDVVRRLAFPGTNIHLAEIGPILIGLGCLQLSGVVGSIQCQTKVGETAVHSSQHFTLQALELLAIDSATLIRQVDDTKGLPAELASRFLTARTLFCRHNPMTILQLALGALKAPLSNELNLAQRLDRICQSRIMGLVLRDLIQQDHAKLHNVIQTHLNELSGKAPTPESMRLITTLIDPSGLLGQEAVSIISIRVSNHKTELQGKDTPKHVTSVFDNVDEFSWPAFAVGLSLLVTVGQRNPKFGDELCRVIVAAAKDAAAQGREHWAALLRFIPCEFGVSRWVRVRAKEYSNIGQSITDKF